MNFYINDSIENLEPNDENVELDDNMIDYIYSIKYKLPNNFFFTIDQYSDTLIDSVEINQILVMCKYIINNEIYENYEDSLDLNETIINLYNLCAIAIKKNKKMVIIGD